MESFTTGLGSKSKSCKCRAIVKLKQVLWVANLCFLVLVADNIVCNLCKISDADWWDDLCYAALKNYPVSRTEQIFADSWMLLIYLMLVYAWKS